MIRKPVITFLNADYEVFDADELVGYAEVVEGTILKLFVKSEAQEDFKGQVLSALLSGIVGDANKVGSGLSIFVSNTKTLHLRRDLERFGFRHTGGNLYKRNTGSIEPPSVIY